MVCKYDCPSGMSGGTPVPGDDSGCVSSTDCVRTRYIYQYYTPCYQNGAIQVWKYCNSEWGNCC